MTLNVAGIVFAETRGLTDEPAGGLVTLRKSLAWLVGKSSDGYGFATAQEPTMADLGDPETLAAWQGCTDAAAHPIAPADTNANVAFFHDSDPQADARLKDDYPWLAYTSTPVAAGHAQDRGHDVQLWLMSSPQETGLFPRSSDVFLSLPQPGFQSRLFGATLFVVCLAFLCVSAHFVRSAARAGTGKACQAVLDLSKAQKTWESDCVARLRALGAADNDFVKVEADNSGDDRTTRLATARDKVKKARQDAYPGGPSTIYDVIPAYAASIVGILGLMMLVGFGLRRNVFGFLIDERGRMSLSRFQLVAWTVAILAAYWVAAAWNLGLVNVIDTSLLPSMSIDLWILLGIVTTSPLVSTLVLGAKSTPAAGGANGDASDANSKSAPPHVPPEAVGNKGVLDVRTRSNSWSFLDLFIGEEVGNRSSVDISRVQQFLFTLVTLFAFGALTFEMFSHLDAGRRLVQLPPLDASLVGLLALSHAAYLTAKTLPKGSG